MNFEMIKILNDFCMKENNKLLNSGFEYEVLQLSDIDNETLTTAYFISKFYNDNYCGNIDFMHIPNFEQTVENIIKYPIVVAREKDSREILGVSILKYFDSSEMIDPYFPIEDARYFSVTGILTSKENKDKGYYGIGKKIYEIMLESALKYKEEYDNAIRLMCVIDCRNNNSLGALKVATDNLNFKYNDKKMDSLVVGYYDVLSFDSGLLVEAPTFVIEMLMDSLIGRKCEKVILKYDNNSETKEESYFKMKEMIDEKFSNENKNNMVVNIDSGCGIVRYYPLLTDNYSLENILIDSNGTELGNDRVPISAKQFDKNVTKYICQVIKNDLINSSGVKHKKLVKRYAGI